MEVLQKEIKFVEYDNKKLYIINNKDKDVLNENSEFLLGSVTKIFTAITLLVLHQKNIININHKVIKYLENKQFKNITILDLINHVSGMKNINDGHDYDKGVSKKYKNATETYNSFKNEKLITKPKGNKLYSNIGYITLGAIIEHVTDMEYTNVVEQYILKPLNIQNTDLGETNIKLYSSKGTKVSKNGYYERFFASSAGQYHSTINDLIKFADFPKLLNKNTLQILKKIYINWEKDGNNIIIHQGGIIGGKSSLRYKYNKEWKLLDIYIKLNTITH